MPKPRKQPPALGRSLGRTIVLAASAAADAPAKAPTEFMVIPIGEFQAQHFGEEPMSLSLSAEDAKAIVDGWAARGRDMQIDNGHASMDANASLEQQSAVGWIGSLEARTDGIYAINVTWLEPAASMIAEKKLRYFSPVLMHDASGAVKDIVNIAVTNDPALFGLRPLAASATGKLRRISLEGVSFTDVIEAICKALRNRFQDAWPCEVFDDHVIFETGGREFSIAYTFDPATESAVLSGEAVEVECVYQPVDGGMKMLTVLTALGLPKDASEAQALAAVTKIADSAKELAALTGKPSGSEQLAVVQAWKAGYDAHSASVAELAAVKAKAESDERDALIVKAKEEGQIVPALEPWAKQQDLASLKAFLAVAPKLPGSPAQGKTETLSGKKFEELSRAEKHRMANDEPATYAALKEDHQRRTGAR